MKLCLIVCCGETMYQAFPESLEQAEEWVVSVKQQGSAVLLDEAFQVVAMWRKHYSFDFSEGVIETFSLGDLDNLKWERVKQ